MRALSLFGLGIVVWGLTLLWPEINQLFASWVTVVITLGLGAVVLAGALLRRLYSRHDENGAGQDHPSHPVPVAVSR